MVKDGSDPPETTLTGSSPGSAIEIPYLIALTGLGAGSIFRLEGELMVGRDLSCHIRLLDRDVSRKHARLTAVAGEVSIEDLGSTNGVSVNGQRITGSRHLSDGDAVSIGSTTVLKFTYHDGIQEEFQRKIQDRARRDSLTGVYNKEYFEERLRTELAHARRHRSALTLLMLDVDRLQEINERWDRITGDAVLVRLARRIEPHVRAEELLARHGGGVFALLCRGISRDQARAFAERLRVRIRNEPFPVVGDAILVTASIGVGTFPAEGVDEPADLLAVAYAALLEAKEAGRDRVHVASPELGAER